MRQFPGRARLFQFKVIILRTPHLHLSLESLAYLPIEEEVHLSGRKLRVALMSCGLGRVQRGFEISTKRLFDALTKHTAVNVRLFTGGKCEQSTEIINIPRDFLLNTVLAPIVFVNRRRIWEFAYGVEQVTYAIFVLGELVKYKPDIVWTKEAPLAHILHYARILLGLKFKILFANGGGFKPATYALFDHIQQLEEASVNDAVAAGVPREKMTVIPNAVPRAETNISKEEARRSFNFAPGDWVVLCVAAWNSYHKRIDVLIDEVADIQDSSLQLLLCGHPEPGSNILKERAVTKLGKRAHWHTLSLADMPRALKAADVFVLPSIKEHFGSAALEAIMASVPVVVHANGSTKLLADTTLKVSDLSVPGSIERRLQEIKAAPPSANELSQLAQITAERFSEQRMAERFMVMMNALMAKEPQLVRMR
jgi:glycosyltransferase involved in cell wall biosynthesis